jgi:hypothetical protein
MKTYRVGQILFLISESNKVLPIQVIEEVVRTTLNGKEKTYIIKFPDKDGSKTDIQKIKGELFESRKNVFDYMINNTTNAINNMLDQAESICADLFDVDVSKPEKETTAVPIKESIEIQKVQPKIKQSKIITVDLGNGKLGKISEKEFEKIGDSE